MKKMLNDVADAVDEMIAGYVLAYGSRVRVHEANRRIVLRAVPKAAGKVAIVIGNGSGHEPIAIGWVGEGLLDANAVGDIFAAPSPDLVCDAIRVADRGGGVLLLISNHAGDVMNGEAGAELARQAGNTVETLLMYDDISTGTEDQRDVRRGAAGTTFIYKLCGALAETGAPLAEVKSFGERMRDNTVTLGASLTPGISPLTGKSMFELPDDEVFIGMGVHGEPGVAKMPIGHADTIVSVMMKRLLGALSLSADEAVLVLVNGMGGTTVMELLVIYRRVAEMLAAKGISLADEPLIGNYVTTQEMGGFSISLMRADDVVLRHWRAPHGAPLFLAQTARTKSANGPID